MNKKSSRRFGAVALAIAALMMLSACGGGSTPPASSGGNTPPASSGAALTGTITLWHFFTGDEAGIIQKAIDSFQASHPGITVDVHSNQDDSVTLPAISSGEPIDVVISYSTDQVGVLCSTGAFQDLAPYVSRDNIDLSQIPPTPREYTQFNGKRCAVPMLADVTAMYYNTDMLAAKGLKPPKTLAELADDAVALTTYNPDGSINVLGFNPLNNYYETNDANYAAMAQAKWLTDDGSKSVIGTDPNWVTILNWQKDLIQRLGGYDKLHNWAAASGDEFSTQHDFYTGRIAMMIDGEWRTGFLGREKPEMKYGITPLPMSPDHPEAYGAGGIDGNVLGIPKTSKNPDLAWELVKYLAFDTGAEVQLANDLRNMPTINSALTSPDLKTDANYQVLIDAFTNQYSSKTPASTTGTGYQDLMATFVENWEQGKVADLKAGLVDVSNQIDQQIALGS